MTAFGIWAAAAQQVPIGSWLAHLPYNNCFAVADAGEKVYCANEISAFAFNKSDNSFDRLNTAAGFSDVGLRGLFYDKAHASLVMAYTNSNLDFVLNGEIVNYPFIRNSNINGDKNVYHAAFKGDTIILSCGFGIVLYDIVKQESPATFFFTDAEGANMRVNMTAVSDGYIYAASSGGLYRGALDEPNLQDFSNWELQSGTDGLPDSEVHMVVSFNEALYAQLADTLYQNTGADWSSYFFETDWHTRHISTNTGHMVISQVFGDTIPADSCRILVIDALGGVEEIINEAEMLNLMQAIIDDDGAIWYADTYTGFKKYKDGIFAQYLPNGPGSGKSQDIFIANGLVFVAPGEVNASWNYQFNADGFFVLDYGYWNNINRYTFSALDTIFDLFTVTVDPRDNTAWLGSFGRGLIRYNRPGGTLDVFKQGYLESVPGDAGSYRVGGLALDSTYNLWISNFGAVNPIAVRKADGTWQHYNPGLSPDIVNQVGQIAIDQFNTKWVQLPRGNGILVFNENGTLDNTADDLIKVLGAGAGNGNLHTNFVNCIAVDKQNEIWVGTSEGITIFYNPGEVYTNTTAGDATQPLVNLGGYYEQLLRNDIVNTIAVDGANRKWVGTNSGAFLISADGTEQLLYFNEDNSPLISNTVTKIAIDGISGEVYFGTDKGIISYRHTATEGVEEISDVKVFPNPVREDYTGEIAISGLTRDAEVRITDMAGRTIWQTTALGGQAIWNGNGYDGNRAATGVYMVYSTNEDGTQTAVAKILLISSK